MREDFFELVGHWIGVDNMVVILKVDFDLKF